LYFEPVDGGHKTVELPPSVMGRYIIHLAHATQAVNSQEFTPRKRTMRKYLGRVDKMVSLEPIRNLLVDDSLDK
jgi:hypothetical protein